MQYKTKGLEMLMYDGVHPDEKDEQHASWKNTWVSLQEIVGGRKYYEYHGLGYYYFVDFVEAKVHCYEEKEDAYKAFNPNTCVWIDVSCHQCHRVNTPVDFWEEFIKANPEKVAEILAKKDKT